MADIKWIKITTDIFDDEKIRLIEAMPEADSIIVIWFKMLTLAGRQNADGILRMNNTISYTDEMLATLFRRPLNTVRLALKTFESFGMIEIIDSTIIIPNWEKHQNIDGIEKVRAQTRKRVAEYRQRQKQKLLEQDVTLHVTLGNGTEQEQDKERELDIYSSCSMGTGGFTNIWNCLSAEETDALYEEYIDAGDLIQEVYEDVKAKKKIVNEPYRFICGYAKNKGWQKNVH